MMRSCRECGARFRPRHARHYDCPLHEQHGRAHRGPSTQAQDAEYSRKRDELLADGPSCHWCPAPATTADHEPAIADGGDHDHMVPACWPCNASRGGLESQRWRQQA